MNNFYTLIYLTQHLNDSLSGGIFNFSYSPHKDVWEAYIEVNSEVVRLVFSSNPSETVLFRDQFRAPKKSNVTEFFESLNGKTVTEIQLADNDRIVTLHFEKEFKLVFQLFGNSPNVFLIKDSLIQESFKSNSEFAGKPEPEPRKPNPNRKKPDNTLSAKQIITRLYPKFPRHLISYIIDEYNLEEKDVDEIDSIAGNMITAITERPQFRVLEDGNLCLIPEGLLKYPNKKTFENVNEAIKFTYYETSKERRLSSKLRTLKPKIEQTLQRNESTITQLEEADKGLERAETYEKYGHLLMANAHIKTDPTQQDITVEDLYDEGAELTIQVKPNLSIAENAKRYYDKSTKAIRNVEESKKRLKKISAITKEIRSLLESLNEIEKVYEFNEWYSDNVTDLKRLGILAKTQQSESLPYRRVTIDNYEVWIGKNAKSNDRLITDAHKEDVWLHARGVSGSHVLIRMNNQKEMPPKSTLLKAASVAAWNSKARGSKLAPVIISKRKYISKPKGAPAGAVTVQKEIVEMVTPQKLPTP